MSSTLALGVSGCCPTFLCLAPPTDLKSVADDARAIGNGLQKIVNILSPFVGATNTYLKTIAGVATDLINFANDLTRQAPAASNVTFERIKNDVSAALDALDLLIQLSSLVLPAAVVTLVASIEKVVDSGIRVALGLPPTPPASPPAPPAVALAAPLRPSVSALAAQQSATLTLSQARANLSGT